MPSGIGPFAISQLTRCANSGLLRKPRNWPYLSDPDNPPCQSQHAPSVLTLAQNRCSVVRFATSLPLVQVPATAPEIPVSRGHFVLKSYHSGRPPARGIGAFVSVETPHRLVVVRDGRVVN